MWEKENTIFSPFRLSCPRQWEEKKTEQHFWSLQSKVIGLLKFWNLITGLHNASPHLTTTLLKASLSSVCYQLHHVLLLRKITSILKGTKKTHNLKRESKHRWQLSLTRTEDFCTPHISACMLVKLSHPGYPWVNAPLTRELRAQVS